MEIERGSIRSHSVAKWFWERLCPVLRQVTECVKEGRREGRREGKKEGRKGKERKGKKIE